MAEVSVSIGGRRYAVVCDDGQEERLASLAARIDAEAQAFAAAGATISEARLLLMSALMVADKLDEAEATMAAAPPAQPVQPQTAPAEAPPETAADLFATSAETEAQTQDVEDAIETIEDAIERINALGLRTPEGDADASNAPVVDDAAPDQSAESETDAKAPETEAESAPKPMDVKTMRQLRRERRRARMLAAQKSE